MAKLYKIIDHFCRIQNLQHTFGKHPGQVYKRKLFKQAYFCLKSKQGVERGNQCLLCEKEGGETNHKYLFLGFQEGKGNEATLPESIKGLTGDF